MKQKYKKQNKTKQTKQTNKDTKTTDYHWNDNPRLNIIIYTICICIYYLLIFVFLL